MRSLEQEVFLNLDGDLSRIHAVPNHANRPRPA
jgi:hypothetical protein